MKKFKELFESPKGLLEPSNQSFTKSEHGPKKKKMEEQHRERGRFKPTIPHNVPSILTATPKKVNEDFGKPTPSVEEVAKKHGVSVDEINKQLEMGIKVEKEHTSDPKMAREIALDHLNEKPNYYSKLKKYVEMTDMEYQSAGSGARTLVDKPNREPMKTYKQFNKDNKITEGENPQVKGGDPCWKDYEMVGFKNKGGKKVPNCVPVKEEKDDVGEMIKDKLKIIINRAQEMHDGIDGKTDMPEWVKSKITLAQDYISTACDYSCGKEQLGEAVEEPPIHVRSMYTRQYAKHGGTISTAKTASAKAYDAVEKMHGKEMRDKLEAFHRRNMNEDFEQIDEVSDATLTSYKEKAKASADELESQKQYGKALKRRTGVLHAVSKMTGRAGEKIGQLAKEAYDISPGQYSDPISKMRKKENETPFEPEKTKQKVVVGKAGKGMATARHLARQALKKQVEKMKPMKESLQESRKADIVKEIVKKKKNEETTEGEKFQKEPMLSSEITKA